MIERKLRWNILFDFVNYTFKAKRDDNGKIVISPRNVQTTCVKSGKGKSSYFSTPNYITIGEIYLNDWFFFISKGNPYVDPDR